MKLNFSLSLKLTIIVVTVSAVVIFSLTYINIQEQSISFDNIYVDRAIILGNGMNYIIENNYGEINESIDFNRFHNDLDNIKNSNEEIINIKINYFDGESLNFFASTSNDSDILKNNEYALISFEQDAIVKIPVNENNSHLIAVIIPMNITGQISGTYEFLFSMDESYTAFEARANNLMLISFVSLFILIFSFLFLIRRTIVKPVISFRDSAKLIGKGDLDVKVNIDSKDELGELSNAFNKMTDDLKKSRKKIEDYNKILEKLLDQKDQFIGQLGHDLKNPLQPLVGLIPVILDKEKDPKIKEHLKVINQNVEYMRDLIIKTLQLARLRSSNIKFDFQNIPLSEIISNILERQKIFFEEHSIKTDLKIDDKTTVYADKLQLEELLNNLISNGVKYTPDTGGRITINSEEDNDFVTISIKDTGIGMTEEQLKKVFDEFYKSDISKHEMESTGLGLSICKRIVEKHGGKIWVDSPGPNKGSIFYFSLKKGKQKT